MNIGKACVCDDIARCPADVTHVRRLIKSGGKWLAVVNVALVAVAVALMVVIGAMIHGRQTADGNAAADTSLQDGGNKVVSSDNRK